MSYVSFFKIAFTFRKINFFFKGAINKNTLQKRSPEQTLMKSEQTKTLMKSVYGEKIECKAAKIQQKVRSEG